MAHKAKRPRKQTTGETWELSAYLIRTGLTSARAALHANSKTVQIHAIQGLGELVVKNASPKVPRWAERLGKLVTAVADVRQQSPGAVLFVPASGRLVALVFGYGRSLVDPEALEHDFGIRTVLNSVDAGQLRSVDARTLEVSPQLTRRQFAEAKPLESFGIDRLHELLKGVAGQPNSATSAMFDSGLISGTDALHCRVRVNAIADLRTRCTSFVSLYKSTNYRTEYGFIDHVVFVRNDDSLKRKLHELLWSQSRAPADIGFSTPNILRGEDLARLRCSWATSLPASDIDVEMIRRRLVERAAKASDVDKFITQLKADKVELLDQAGSPVDSWSLYRCLLTEVRHQARTYVLTTGDWYAVDKDFLNRVVNDFDSIVQAGASCPLKLPAQTAACSNEDLYNKYAAPKIGGALLDKTNMMKGLSSSVEPCDIVHVGKGVFVHVKLGRKSAVLSHLFNQGLVATTIFLDEERARDRLRGLLGRSVRGPLAEPIDASRLTTVFAIVDGPPVKKKSWRLPFFSMLVARSVTERLRQRGVNVYTVRVDAA